MSPSMSRGCFFWGWWCFVTFLFIFHVLGCFTCVGLLEYVLAEGWWSQACESEEDEGVLFLFTVFFSFFSLTLRFAASFCYCIMSYCSSWTPVYGSWACILTSARPACQWQFEIWHARDLPSIGKSERDGKDTWCPGNTRTVACVSSHQNRQKQVADR